MSGHGTCSKCNCQSYTKSLLTPGLCKNCQHVKATHNQFIHHNEEDLDEKSKSTALLKGSKKTTTFDYSSESDEETSHEKRHRKFINDNYPQPIIKKKKVINHTETMWQNKWKESQKEVEKWQAKYNDLYLKYKDLEKEKETWQLQTHKISKKNKDKNVQNNNVHVDFLSVDNDKNNEQNKKNDNDFSEWQTF